MPPFYIGYSSTEKVLNEGYRGTVVSREYKKIWYYEQRDNPHLFKTVPLSFHASRKEANRAEIELLQHFRAHRNPMYINMGIGGTDYAPKRHRPHSEETKQRMRESALKKPPMSDRTREIMSIQRTGRKKSESHRRNLGLSHVGSFRSDEQKTNISTGCKNQPKEACPHCGLITTRSNLKRWHGDNCKKYQLSRSTSYRNEVSLFNLRL